MSNYLDNLNFSDTSYLEDLDFTKPVSLYGGEIEGENIQPDRDRTIYNKIRPSFSRSQPGSVKITPFEDKYDIRDIPIDVNGQTRYISYGEINKVDDNGNYLHPTIKKSHEDIDLKFKDNSVFDKRVEKKYVGGISPTTGIGTGGRIVEQTIQPFEEELDYNRKLLNEMAELGTVESLPQRFQFEGDEVPDDILKSYTRQQLVYAAKNEAIIDVQGDALADMGEDYRKATEKRAAEIEKELPTYENIENRQKELELKENAFFGDEEQGLEPNKVVKDIKSFVKNVEDPDYKYETDGKPSITLFNGKQVPQEVFDKYKEDLLIYNQQLVAFQKEAEKLYEDYTGRVDVEQELGILKKNHSLADKFMFNAISTTGSLVIGLGEFLESTANVVRDVKPVGVPGGVGFTYVPLEGNEFTTVTDFGQKYRNYIENERKKYRDDVKFKDAFDGLDNFGRFIVEETGRQLPIFAMIAASGGTASALGASTMRAAAVSGTTLGVMTGGQQMGDMTFEEAMSKADQFKFNDKEYSDLKKYWTGVGFGAAEGILGTAPTFLLGQRFLQNGYKLFSKKGSEKILKDIATKRFDRQFARELGKETGIGIAAESISEGLTQMTQNAFVGRPIMENVDHATFSGGFFGGTLGGGSVIMGAAMRSMMDKKTVAEIDDRNAEINDLRRRRIMHDPNSDTYKQYTEQIENKQKQVDDKIEEFNNNWRNTMSYSAFNAYKNALDEQAKIRNKAREIQDGSLDDKNKQKALEDLGTRYEALDIMINDFKSGDYQNKFKLLQTSDPKAYERIIKQAKDKLRADGREATDGAVNKVAYEMYTAEQVDKRVKATNKILKLVSLDTQSNNFKSEQEAKAWAKLELEQTTDPSYREYLQSILSAKEGSLNGLAGRSKENGVSTYRYITIGDNQIKNERSGTATHEASHLIFWSALLGDFKGDFSFDLLAQDIYNYTKKYEPKVHKEMFGFDPAQRVETESVGPKQLNMERFKPEEVVMNFIERAGQMDVNKIKDSGIGYTIANFANKLVGRDVTDVTTQPNAIDFLIGMGKKIENGTLTRMDLFEASRNKLFDKYKVKRPEGPKQDTDTDIAASESGQDNKLFENTNALVPANWNSLTKEEKKNFGEIIGSTYWETNIKNRIKKLANLDPTDVLKVTSEFLLGPKSRSRGLAEIISRYDPVENPGITLAAWINSGDGQLNKRLLGPEFIAGAETMGAFKTSTDERSEDRRDLEIEDFSALTDIQNMSVKETQNQGKQRKFLDIKETDLLYDQFIGAATQVFTEPEIKELLETKPSKVRTKLRQKVGKEITYVDKDGKKQKVNLRAAATEKIGAQKSDKFKKFIRDEKNLQFIIDNYAIKYRSSFPFLSSVDGRMNKETSQANIQSDQGQNVTDIEAGNKIYRPIDMSKMSPEEKTEFIDFVEKAFREGLRIKGSKKGKGYVDKDGNLTGVVDYDGRETLHKALKDVIALETLLDATFTAMQKSPNMKTMMDGVIIQLQEQIKRSPDLAFSVSNAGGLQKLSQLAKLVMNKGYDSVFKSPGVLNDEFVKDYTTEMADLLQDIYDAGIIEDADVYLFMQALNKSVLIPDSIKKELVKSLGGQTMTKKTPLESRKIFANEMKIFAQELGGDIIRLLDQDSALPLLGFINRVLDPASRKVDEVATLKNKQRVAKELSEKEGREITLDELKKRKEGKGLTVYKKGVTGDFYDTYQIIKNTTVKSDLIDGLDLKKVRLMNIGINGGLFDRINKILNDEKLNAKQKREKLSDPELQQEIKDANVHNKLLIKHILTKLIDSDISDLAKVQLLQLQTSAVAGLRALTSLDFISITDKPLGTFKGEHLEASSNTMFAIAELVFKAKTMTNAEISEALDEILEGHSQLIENRKVLDDFVDKFGRLNTTRDLRMKAIGDKFNKIIGRKATILTSDMKPADAAIAKAEAKVKLKRELAKSKSSRKLLTHIVNKASKRKGISVFDFDDTLAKSNSKVGVTMPDGKKFKINATRFALESADLEAAGAIFDFSEFNKVIEGKKGPLFDLAMRRQDKFTSKDIFILTARPAEAAYSIHAFLKGMGLEIPIDNIVGLADGRPEAKSDWILDKAAEGYNDFYFADDALKNVKAVKKVLEDLKVRSDVELAKAESKESLDNIINKIIEHQSGVRKDTRYSQVVARRRGKNQDRYTVWLPPSAEDFAGLLHYLTGKGEQGSKDLEWLMDNLVKPYHAGVDALKIARVALKSDYKKLLKQNPEIGKRLNKLLEGSDFTVDQAIRIYIWNKQGQKIPDIAKRDIATVNRLINQDPDLRDFANSIEKIGSVNGVYLKPEVNWEIGTILRDLNDTSQKIGRKEYLKDWLETVDAVFTKATLNKIEAIYGTRFREALEDVIYRMKTGSNRPTGANRITNRWLNWINNATAGIMFFNRKSALLQSISTINYINWSDNNPFMAAKAFANFPQWLADFVYIWNSPKLKERRSGLQSDLQLQEIANAAAGSKNKANAIISYLLKIGFTPTQLVDNFAIAAGGASMYRNRINTNLKKGMSLKEAEDAAWKDFSSITENTQQSGDPALISQEQATQLGRLVLAFQNTPMQINRLMKKSGMMIVRRQRYPGMTQMQSDFTNMGRIIYYGAIQNFIFNALQQAWFAMLPGFDEDDDPDYFKNLDKEDAKIAKTFNQMLDTVLRGSGLKGAVISTIKNTILMYQKQEEKGFRADHAFTILEVANISPPIGSKLRKLYSGHLTKKYNKEVLEERGWALTADGKINLSPRYEILANQLAAILNLPVDRALIELEAMVEMMDDRNATWQRIALALGWRTWDVNAKNEEEDLIKFMAKQRKKQIKKNKKKTGSQKSYLDDLDF